MSKFDNRLKCIATDENIRRSDTEENKFTASDALDTEQEIKESRPVIERPPIKCPRCGGELDPAPDLSWACWSCRERLVVRGGSR